MPSRDAQSQRAEPGQHLVLYDGVCGFCSGVVQSILQRDPGGVFHFAALQSPFAGVVLARFGINPADMNTFYVVRDYREPSPRCLAKGRAVLFVMTILGRPWKSLALLQHLPDRLLDTAYDFIARNRYRVLGRREQCVPPRAELRSRFVDTVLPTPEVSR